MPMATVTAVVASLRRQLFDQRPPDTNLLTLGKFVLGESSRPETPFFF